MKKKFLTQYLSGGPGSQEEHGLLRKDGFYGHPISDGNAALRY